MPGQPSNGSFSSADRCTPAAYIATHNLVTGSLHLVGDIFVPVVHDRVGRQPTNDSADFETNQYPTSSSVENSRNVCGEA